MTYMFLLNLKHQEVIMLFIIPTTNNVIFGIKSKPSPRVWSSNARQVLTPFHKFSVRVNYKNSGKSN